MSCDRTEQEYHLTPSGWELGSLLVYGEGEKPEPPADRVETWLIEKYQSSSYSAEKVTKRLIWVSPDYTESERAALIKKFPFPIIHTIQQVYYGKRKKR